MRKKSAFTVLEILFVMLIIIILISFSSHTYQQLFSQQTLLTSSKKLYQFLRLAKSQSVKYNQKVYVHFCQKGVSGEWWMAQSTQASCDCFTEKSCLVDGVQFSQQLSDGQFVLISPADITFTSQRISYHPMRFSVNAGSVTLNDNLGNRLKVIQSTLRLRICALDSDKFGYTQC